MTDNEVIKALECCSRWELTKDCSECAYESSDGICRENLFSDTLDLINRQKAEIERLNKEVDRLSQCVMYHVINAFGKTVFLTKEEAEQALKGGVE